ncbi:hypothetical protein K505DRAFT_316804 [Melanomma pulvis-pyrius CBS 109.77]|uniref:Uncharacterized protein n=1 Tax=Melanomma pulvis-pyrius CBS 109.77 TaxID=1314802 RepID=A0A6A6WTY9_9PLEO|nr:hypothetical protein K505DRAFT_316804 [Melanomma pulvis-pyrius CBS 109.77]
MQDLNAQPFPFMELPPELRDMVYEYLVEDPYYPPPAPSTPSSSPLNWLMPSQWPVKTTEQEKKPKKGSWIFLASKQIYAEYTEVGCKKSTFHLSVTPTNYPKPVPTCTTTAAITSSPGAAASSLWKIAPDTLKQIRKCDIKLVITSSMLGVPDPRNMTPDSWALAHQVRAELRHVSKVQELNLHVKAIGDPLWNPLWNTPEHTQSDESAGPKLNRITFSLDTWSPGENYLERDAQSAGQWAWWCTKGHCIGPDGGSEVTVREFCAKLYMECRTCRPDLEGEDEEDDE